MTKEEILEQFHNYKKWQDKDYGSKFNCYLNIFEVEKAMDEYAKQMSIEFEDWLADCRLNGKIKNLFLKTTSELYELFLKDKHQAK